MSRRKIKNKLSGKKRREANLRRAVDNLMSSEEKWLEFVALLPEEDRMKADTAFHLAQKNPEMKETVAEELMNLLKTSPLI